MALDGTITKVSALDVGDKEQLVVDLQGPSSYTNGGEAFLPSLFPFRTGGLSVDTAEGKDDDTLASAKLDPTAGTLNFFAADGTEELNLANLSGNSYRLSVLGR